MMRNGSSSVFWAEDNKRDRMLIEAALEGIQPPPNLVLVNDGVLLLQALEARVPDLVVLDLKMPRMGGIEVLRTIRGNPSWKEIPVAVFTSGNRPSELAECAMLGVRTLAEKPVDFDLFSSAVQRIISSAQPAAASEPTAPSPPGVTDSHEH